MPKVITRTAEPQRARPRRAALWTLLCVAAALYAVGGCSDTSGPSDADGDEPDMVLIPAGWFVMGDAGASCATEHAVALTRDFYLGRHEVTNQEYLDAVQWAYDNDLVIAMTFCVWDNLDGEAVELLDLWDPDCEIAFSWQGVFSLRDRGHGINPEHPVKEVTWFGAARYCDWLSLQAGLPRAYEHKGDWSCNRGDPYGASGYRLPTEAEWEYAAQYNDGRIYPWGNRAPDASRANYDFLVRWTTPVGGYPAGRSSLGLSDMGGNVWEWCDDRYVSDLGTSLVSDPVSVPGGRNRLVRGGSWAFYDAALRLGARYWRTPGDSRFDQGFRVARTDRF